MSNIERTKKIFKYELDENPKNNIFKTSKFKHLDQETAEILHEIISSPDVMKLNDDELYSFLCPNKRPRNN